MKKQMIIAAIIVVILSVLFSIFIYPYLMDRIWNTPHDEPGLSSRLREDTAETLD